jgi:anti-sigma factor RsiW
MSCDQGRWLHGYFDGELDAARAAEFEAHLRDCTACTQALSTQHALRSALQGAELYASAPSALRDSVRTAMGGRQAGAHPRTLWRSLAAAASVALVAFGLWRTVASARDGAAETRMAAQVLDAHLRSLQLAHLTDVASTDQHTVKPWFAGKLDFAPPVRDLQSAGYPLLGGRLDVVGGRTVAALVYGRGRHVVNVFVWPAGEADEAPRTGDEHGYRWIHWTRGGMRYWAVSDVEAADLRDLGRLLGSS